MVFGGGVAYVEGELRGDGRRADPVRGPQGKATPLHIHANEDEALYVLDGEVVVHIDGTNHRVGPRGFAKRPPRTGPEYSSWGLGAKSCQATWRVSCCAVSQTMRTSG